MTSGRGRLAAFAALSASHFAHIGFFDPYLSLRSDCGGRAVSVAGAGAARGVHSHQLDDVADRGRDSAAGGRRLGPPRAHPALGSAGFLVTVFAAGWWFERFGVGHFPAWAGATLAAVLVATLRLPDMREPVAARDALHEPAGPVLRQPALRWFFASLFHVMAHFSVYGFLSVPRCAGHGQGTIGPL